MNNRLEFSKILRDILGSESVYFQPPPTVKMTYPAIVYSRARPNVGHADDKIYRSKQAYQVMVIDANPDSELPAKVAALPYSRFESSYTADNLNHDVYNVFY